MIREITKFQDLLEDLPFILESLDAMKDGRVPKKLVVEAIRKNIGSDNFMFLIQEDERGKAFMASFVAANVYEERVGVIWLLRNNKGNIKEFFPFMRHWFKEQNCKFIEAGNATFSKAKERWLKRMGFKLYLQQWRLEV